MNRIISIFLFLLFLSLTARGVYVLATSPAPGGDRADSAQNTAFVLLTLFAALTLVFGFTAMRLKRSS